jgi:hypothetical protein
MLLSLYYWQDRATAGRTQPQQAEPRNRQNQQQANPKYNDFQWANLSPLSVENGITIKSAINTT